MKTTKEYREEFLQTCGAGGKLVLAQFARNVADDLDEALAQLAAERDAHRLELTYVAMGERERDAVRIAQLESVLQTVEHVKLPGMGVSRCPVCLSPCDLSQPHEKGCPLERALYPNDAARGKETK